MSWFKTALKAFRVYVSAKRLIGTKDDYLKSTGRGGVRVEGVNRTLARMQKLAKKDRQALEIGMKKAGAYLLKRSKEIVPVKTGRLRRSGFNRLTTDTRNTVVYQVGYSRRYAIFVHERLDLAHAKGKSAKFLEKPAREHRKTLIKIIENEVKKAGV